MSDSETESGMGRGSQSENMQKTKAGLHGKQGEQVRDRERAGDVSRPACEEGQAGQRPRTCR